MPTPQQYLELARRVAKKSRAMIPRSQNRQIKKATWHNRKPSSSEWVLKDIPEFLSIELAAQRSSKQVPTSGKPTFSAKAPTEQELATIRQCVLDAKLDLSMRQRRVEQAYDATAVATIIQSLKSKGIDLAAYYPGDPPAAALVKVLGWRARLNKTSHRDGTAVQPLERLEANAKSAVTFQVGNCVECASLAFVMLMEYAGPGGDAALPDLAALRADRPVVEKAKVSNPGDHHFVLLNRNTSIDIQDPSWTTDPHVVICDPWWFTDDGGDAHFFVAKQAKALGEEILANKAGLAVDLAMPLGSGHSTRFATKHAATKYWTS